MEDEKRDKSVFSYNTENQKKLNQGHHSLENRERSLGNNIRKERELRGLTLEELAELTGLSSSYLGLLERGERHPSFKVLSFLLDFFSLEPNDLMLDADNKNSLFQEDTHGAQRNKSKTVEALIRGLNDAEIDFFIDYLKLYRKYRPMPNTIDSENK